MCDYNSFKAENVMQFEFYVPTRIVFGEGTLSELNNRYMPGRKALLVMSKGGSAVKSGAYDRVYQALSSAGAPPVVYAGIGSNPTL